MRHRTHQAVALCNKAEDDWVAIVESKAVFDPYSMDRIFDELPDR